MTIYIGTHDKNAKERLLQQYKGKKLVEGLLSAFAGKQIQDIEDATYGMLSRLNIDLSEGNQLDRIGEIIGQQRLGLPDKTYKIFLKARVAQNVSEGDHERIIQIFKLLTEASLVHLMSLGNAEIEIASDGSIDLSLINAILNSLSGALGCAIRANHICFFDATEPFAFEGEGASVIGFGFADNEGDLTGGKLADCISYQRYFAFEPEGLAEFDNAGFGDPADPYLGGIFVD